MLSLANVMFPMVVMLPAKAASDPVQKFVFVHRRV